LPSVFTNPFWLAIEQAATAEAAKVLPCWW
jgi:hypothetical protein